MVKIKNTSLTIHASEKIGNIIILECKEAVTLSGNPRTYKIACIVKGTA